MIIINNKTFSELRKKENISREHLAVKLGMSASVIQVLETDPKHNSSIIAILKYLKYFNVKFESLVFMDDIKLGDAL